MDFKRDRQKHEFWKLIYFDMKKNKNLAADTKIICSNGSLFAHSYILSSLSSYFGEMFKTQGECYQDFRLIILPDFNLVEMNKLIQFLYCGEAKFKSESERTALINNLKFFKINCKDEDVFLETLIVKQEKLKKRKIGQTKKIKSIDDDEDDDETTFSEDDLNLNLSIEKKAKLSSENDSEPPLRLSHSTNSPFIDTNNIKISPKPFVPLKELKVIISLRDKKHAEAKCASNISEEVTIKNNNDGNSKITNKELKTEETFVEIFEKPNYKSKRWFKMQIRKCQYCKKNYENMIQATECLYRHKKIRCCFCFNVFADSDKLFDHFKCYHQHSERENCLICPFCKDFVPVPYESVSCHVISVHLTESLVNKEQSSPSPPQSDSDEVQVIEMPISSSSSSKVNNSISYKKSLFNIAPSGRVEFSKPNKDSKSKRKKVSVIKESIFKGKYRRFTMKQE